MPRPESSLKPGMSPFESLVAFMSDATCGENCWNARDLVCRCSCGGRNHGCMIGEDGTNQQGQKPRRTAKIDGFRYELVAIGEYHEVDDAARQVNESAGPRWTRTTYIDDDTGKYWNEYEWEQKSVKPSSNVRTKVRPVPWETGDKGAPARVKVASKDQVSRWKEVSSWSHPANQRIRPYLLWIKTEDQIGFGR